MGYSTQADVQTAAGGEEKLIQLSDVSNPPTGQVNAAEVAKAILWADGLIDSYVVKRFKVPVDPVPAILADRSAALAAYKLRDNRGMLSARDIEKYEDILVWLRDVAKGLASLGVDPPPAESSYQVDAQHARSEDKDVSREKLKGYW